MKIKKSELKELIKEEVSKAVNEMAIDEMAFSLDDVEAAEAEVGSADTAAAAVKNGERFFNLLRNFQIVVNNAGGETVVDANAAAQLPRHHYSPYSKHLGIVYKVLENLSKKMFNPSTSNHRWPPQKWNLHDVGQIVRQRSLMPGQKSARGSSINHLKNALAYLDDIIEFAKETSEIPAVGFEEPYLSAENAETLAQLAARARTELKL
jgi:hypothetical protein